jgi:hypothetical protein
MYEIWGNWSHINVPIYFNKVVLGFELKVLARQVLYHLSHSAVWPEIPYVRVVPIKSQKGKSDCCWYYIPIRILWLMKGLYLHNEQQGDWSVKKKLTREVQILPRRSLGWIRVKKENTWKIISLVTQTGGNHGINNEIHWKIDNWIHGKPHKVCPILLRRDSSRKGFGSDI